MLKSEIHIFFDFLATKKDRITQEAVFIKGQAHSCHVTIS